LSIFAPCKQFAIKFMIYRFTCTLLRWLMRFYYSRVHIVHTEILPQDKPFILICDHRNSFMDAFVLAICLQRPLYFINPVSKPLKLLQHVLMESLHIVPLQKGWHKHQHNSGRDPWSHLCNLLAQNQPLVFFSEHEDDRLKVSKGAAKIAFHAEEVFDFNLEVQLFPVSIHYSANREATLVIGTGVPVTSFEKEYKHHPAHTIKQTTRYLEEELTNSSKAENVAQIKILTRFHKILELHADTSSLTAFRKLTRSNPVSEDLSAVLLPKLQKFFQLLQKESLEEWQPLAPPWYVLPTILFGWPLFLLGFVVNWSRYQLSTLLSKVIFPQFRHTDSSKMIIGLFLFPLTWFAIAGWVIYQTQLGVGLIALMLLPLIAQFSYWYGQQTAKVINYLKFRFCSIFKPARCQLLEQQYQELLEQLHDTQMSKVITA